MALRCPTGFDKETLQAKVSQTYTEVANNPGGDFHFHRGEKYAINYLGYDPAELSFIPEESKARFAGVGNPHRINGFKHAQVVLDHACGAGMDLLLAARKIGFNGKAIGIDMTPAMLSYARKASTISGLSDITDFREGVYEDLPVGDNTVDIVISNGVINLAPDKEKVFSEIFRVLKTGGTLYMADVIVAREVSLEARVNPDLWAACIAGALTEKEVFEIAESSGFGKCYLTERFDCFKDTSAEVKVSKDLMVHGANFYIEK